MTEIREDEYLDPVDGLIHCRKCGGPRQAVIPDPVKGGSFKPRCVCPCQREAERCRREAEERRQRMDQIMRRKAQGLQDRYLYDYTLANDNGKNPVMAKARAYVDHWPEAFKRNTDYAMEQMFSIVDSRYRSGKPLIVTTNLKLDELKHPPDLAHARIYDRILERCAPILFAGKNFREDNAARTKAAARRIVSADHSSKI